jgi:hypothetical protein
MTAAQIRNSIQTGRLQLSRTQKLNHYFPAHGCLFAGLMVPGITILDFLRDGSLDSVLSLWQVALFSLPWTILSGLLYWHLSRVLLLSRVETVLSVAEIREVCVRLATLKGWSVQNNRKTFVVMKTHPGFSWNWGEKITVLLYKGNVWVNSICDPDFESAFYSSGRNRENRLLIYRFLTGKRGFGKLVVSSVSEESTK